MEKVGLIHIDIHHVIPAQRLLCDIILNGFDPVIHKKLFAVHGPRKSPDTVIHCYDIRIKGTDQIVQGGQWGNLAAGSQRRYRHGTWQGRSPDGIPDKWTVTWLLSKWATFVSPTTGTMEPSRSTASRTPPAAHNPAGKC